MFSTGAAGGRKAAQAAWAKMVRDAAGRGHGNGQWGQAEPRPLRTLLEVYTGICLDPLTTSVDACVRLNYGYKQGLPRRQPLPSSKSLSYQGKPSPNFSIKINLLHTNQAINLQNPTMKFVVTASMFLGLANQGFTAESAIPAFTTAVPVPGRKVELCPEP